MADRPTTVPDMNEVETAPAAMIEAGLEPTTGVTALEITDEMIVAGLKAADLLSLRFGYTAPVPLVVRVFQAMVAAGPYRLEAKEQI
jgi:hypothetical protein